MGRRIEIPAELDEPELGTVVLDRDGQAWQRYRLDWGPTSWGSYSSPRECQISWGELLVKLGPMTVIHEPEKES